MGESFVMLASRGYGGGGKGKDRNIKIIYVVGLEGITGHSIQSEQSAELNYIQIFPYFLSFYSSKPFSLHLFPSSNTLRPTPLPLPPTSPQSILLPTLLSPHRTAVQRQQVPRGSWGSTTTGD